MFRNTFHGHASGNVTISMFPWKIESQNCVETVGSDRLRDSSSWGGFDLAVPRPNGIHGISAASQVPCGNILAQKRCDYIRRHFKLWRNYVEMQVEISADIWASGTVLVAIQRIGEFVICQSIGVTISQVSDVDELANWPSTCRAF